MKEGKVWYKRVWIYITCGILFILAVYATVQGIRCRAAVKESESRLEAYSAETAHLSYGAMSYADKGEGAVILSVHGIFGGYDQAFDTCKDFQSDYRIIAPSRFGYPGSDVLGNGTPAEQAAAYVELLNRFPNCTFVSFEDGGHLMAGHGEEVRKAVADFIEVNNHE